MASVYWSPNAATQSQIVTGTISAVAVGGTLTGTINSKAVTYTCVTGDTTTTAAAGFVALLRASVNPEFQEANWSAASNVVTAMSATPGNPFAGMTGGLVFTAAGGAAIGQATTQPNKSLSDVGDLSNWLRNGVPGLPQDGDDVVLKESTVPMTVNCNALALVRPTSVTRWGSMTGQIGLPFVNPAGYQEYRPTYFAFSGSNGGQLLVTIGVGPGEGPTLEKYQIANTGQITNAVVLAGQQVEIIPGGLTNSLNVHNASVSVCMNPGESTTITSGVKVDSGGTLDIGPDVILTGAAVIANQGTLNLYSSTTPATIVGTDSVINVYSSGVNYTSFVVSGSTVTWLANSAITQMTMRAGSTLDLSQDWRPITIISGIVEADSCQINDPLNRMTMTNPFQMVNPSNSGPFIFGAGKNLKLT